MISTESGSGNTAVIRIKSVAAYRERYIINSHNVLRGMLKIKVAVSITWLKDLIEDKINLLEYLP